jgi:hypothetical protein
MDDHDQRFKELIPAFLPEFLALFLPDWADRFDAGRAEWLEQEAFLDPPDGERRVLDLVARVPTTVPTGTDPAGCLLLLHVEVESGDSAAGLRERMLQYYAYLRRTHDLPVLPVGLYLRAGLGGIGRGAVEEELWGWRVLRLEYLTIGLAALDGPAYHAGPNLLGLALSALMRQPADGRGRRAAEGLDRIAGSGENDLRAYYLASCFKHYFPLDDAERAERDRLLDTVYQRGKTVPTTAAELVARERATAAELVARERATAAELVARERAAAAAEALADRRRLLAKMLARKFGPLPPAVVAAIDALPPERLDEIALALLDARSLADLGLTTDE